MIYGILLILLSIIAVPSLLLSKSPDSKKWLDKITPYQGWIGIIFFIWGVWGLINAILHLGWFTKAPVWWLTLTAGSLVETGLGFILGYGLLNQYVFSKNPEANEKAQMIKEKIIPWQRKLAVLGLIVGVWMVIASFLFVVV